ncbi:MAG TPA: DUF86 domain-containing protein [Atribacter sp.]|uniref:type VII toxin-antitoxin system HepT family RNase toxin n=1 Tax=Atribacter sp. TaxID=2847780 RepID=UPI002B995BAB|nr:DUF86 domain-containing protein [Atribacter sp.]HQK82785.1 DUF86 domain-containing protein [Atribacter sp.]
MVDKTLILRKLANFDEYQNQLSEFIGITIDEYMQDWKIQRIVERTFQILIETGIDIANHIISDQELRIPISYSDTFKVLQENNIINNQLYQSLEKMAKFRNLIVHSYDNIDSAFIISILRNNLDDFTDFKNSVLEWMSKKK